MQLHNPEDQAVQLEFSTKIEQTEINNLSDKAKNY